MVSKKVLKNEEEDKNKKRREGKEGRVVTLVTVVPVVVVFKVSVSVVAAALFFVVARISHCCKEIGIESEVFI